MSVMQTGAPFVSEGLAARRTHRRVIVMAVPTRDAGGRLTGVLTGALLRTASRSTADPSTSASTASRCWTAAAVRCSRGSRARATGRCNGSSSGGRSGCSRACAAWTGAGPPGRLLDRAATGLDDRNRSAPRRCLRGGLARARARPRPARGGCGDRVRPHGPVLCCEPGASPRIATRAPATRRALPHVQHRSARRRGVARPRGRTRGGVPGHSLDRGTRGRGSPRTRVSAVCEASGVPVGGEASRLVVAQVLARVYESGFAFAVESETRMRVDLPEVHDALAGACRSSTQRPCACPARARRARSACSSPTSVSWTSASARMSPGMRRDRAGADPRPQLRARARRRHEPPAQPALAAPAADRRRGAGRYEGERRSRGRRRLVRRRALRRRHRADLRRRRGGRGLARPS